MSDRWAEQRAPDRSARGVRQRRQRRAQVLFEELAALPEAERRQSGIRAELIEMHLPLARYAARNYRHRGEPEDDLVQVATVGLIKCVDRFEPDRGVEFASYALVGMTGEIKRHFRDKGWAVHVSRRLQELRLQVIAATNELSQRLGSAPTVGQLAVHLDLGEEEVLEGLAAANAYAATSLEVPVEDDPAATSIADTLGVVDAALENVEYRESLRPLLARLPVRERNVLLLRFFGNMTQSEIAAQIGVSQMHVSRLLSRTLAWLREELLRDA